MSLKSIEPLSALSTYQQLLDMVAWNRGVVEGIVDLKALSLDVVVPQGAHLPNVVGWGLGWGWYWWWGGTLVWDRDRSRPRHCWWCPRVAGCWEQSTGCVLHGGADCQACG